MNATYKKIIGSDKKPRPRPRPVDGEASKIRQDAKDLAEKLLASAAKRMAGPRISK